MQTLSWFALGLSGVVLLLLAAILIVLTLSRDPIGKREGLKKNGKDKSGVLPSTGSDTGKKIVQELQSVFSAQMLAVMAAFAALEFALWNSGWLPKMFVLPGILQIPTYGILIFIANLVEEKTTGKLKTGARFMMIVAFTIFGLGHLNTDKLAAWWNTQSPPVQTVRQVQSDQCDNLYKPYTVYQTPSVITGAVGCFVGVKVRSTAPVILIGERGEESAPIYNDSPDQVLNFRVVEWKTVPGQVAQVQARLFRQ